MDLVILLVFAVVILLLVGLVLYLKVSDHRQSLYERSLKSEADHDAKLMASAKIVSYAGVGFRVEGVDRSGYIIYKEIVIDKSFDGGVKVIDADQLRIQYDATQLLSDTKQASGGGATQVLTCDAWQAIGHNRDDWELATGWLASKGYVRAIRGVGVKCTKNYDIFGILLDLAVRSLPPCPDRAVVQSFNEPENTGIA